MALQQQELRRASEKRKSRSDRLVELRVSSSHSRVEDPLSLPLTPTPAPHSGSSSIVNAYGYKLLCTVDILDSSCSHNTHTQTSPSLLPHLTTLGYCSHAGIGTEQDTGLDHRAVAAAHHHSQLLKMKMAYDHLGGGGGAPSPLFPSHPHQQQHPSQQSSGSSAVGGPVGVPSLASLWPATAAGESQQMGRHAAAAAAAAAAAVSTATPPPSFWQQQTHNGPMPTLPTGPPSLASQLGAPYGGAATRLVPGLLPSGLNGLNGGALNGGLGAALYGAPPSVLESLAPPPPPKVEQSQIINGFGKLTWLSSKAGLITCANGKTISFQIKDFCDNQLTDLTSVLRVGFTLSFQAALSESSEYIATLVSPLYGQESEKVFASSPEANLEESMPQQTGNNKDAYCLRIEERAIPTLLAIFQRHATPQIQLSSLHSQMSSVSGSDDELFRYVGSSSLKRRQFIERRTHLFALSSDDQITLQQPSIYSCVLRLASHLLRRGGVTAIESLYEFYLSPNMPADIRATIGESRARFIELMQSHQWIFSLFPNRTYVSVRRNLPHYDYPEFVRTYFAECELFRPSFPRGTLQPQYGGASAAAVAAAAAAAASADRANGRAGGLSRTMSTHGANGAGAPGSGAPQPLIPGASRHQSVGGTSSNGRSLAMWGESETASNGSGGGGGRDGRDGRGGGRDDGGAAAAWGFESNNTWRPPSLMTLTTNGLGGGLPTKSTSTMSTQTEMGDGLGAAPGCVCMCNCGAREAARIVSRGSVSPPSAQSASHSPHMNSSPVHTRRDLEAFQAALDSALPTRYYDPFGGFDFNDTTSGLSALNLN